MSELAVHSRFAHNESQAVSLMRSLAVLLILSCHVASGLSASIALYLNVGVQMFFFISGFLYGKKEITNVKAWYLKRAKKILVPYYLWLLCALILYTILRPDMLGLKWVPYVFCLQGFFESIPSLGHLWFLTIIIICYAITPLLQKLKVSKHSLLSFSVVIVFFTGLSIIPKLGYLFWVTVFIFGYVISTYNWTYKIWLLTFCILSTFAVIALNVLGVLSDYIRSLGFHFIVGITVCLSILFFLNALRKTLSFSGVVRWLDDYSYEIYLVHQVFILGPFSLLHYGGSISINIFLIFSLIFFSAIALKWSSNKVYKIIG